MRRQRRGEVLRLIAAAAIDDGLPRKHVQLGEATFDPGAVCMDEKTLMGSYSASVAVNAEVAKLVFAGYRDGTFDLTKLISHRFTLEDAVKGIELASHPVADSMKIVIQP